MGVYPAIAVIRYRHGGKLPIFHPMRHGNSLLEIRGYLNYVYGTSRAQPTGNHGFPQGLGHLNEEITEEMARMAGVSWSPCVYCPKSRVRQHAVP